MGKEMKISEKERNDIAFAVGVILSASEMLLEGKIIDSDGQKMIQKASNIIEKYNITFEEMAIYIKAIAKDELHGKANEIINKRIFQKSKYNARNLFKAGAH